MGRPKGEPIDFPCLDEPTRTERALVSTIKADRENWPAIYLEMSKVTKDDLLEDPDYCARHRNPSLTQFYIESGAMAGMRVSMLRKFERAGRFYEKCLVCFPDLPPLTNPRLNEISPDTLVLILRIEEFINMGSPSESLDVDGLIHRLVSDVVAGHGLERRHLNAWLASLQDASRYGRLDSAIADFITALNPKALSSSKSAYSAAERARCLESFVKGKLQDSAWLDSVVDAEADAEGTDTALLFANAIEIVPDPLRRSERSEGAFYDFAVVDARRSETTVHAIEVKHETRHVEREVMRNFDIAKCAPGVDYYWFATEGEVSDFLVVKLAKLGVGLMVREGDSLRVAFPPAKRTFTSAERSQLLMRLLERIVRKPKRPLDKRSYAEYAVVDLPKASSKG